jgi:HPt (histidine-containing phosphotransfer) domain-containing protein
MNDHVTKPIDVAGPSATLENGLRPLGEDRKPEARQSKAAEEAREPGTALPAEENTPVFDHAGFLERMMKDEELARTVVKGFLGDLPDQIARLKDYVASGDPRLVEGQAHKIKGAAAAVGGEALRAIAATMELVGRSGDVKAVENCLAGLEAQFYALKEAMKALTG